MRTALSAVDFIALAVYLIFTTALGFYFSRFQRSAKEYFLGNRTMPWPAVCLSIVATETSTLTFIGVPALAYGGNMTFMQLTFGYLLARILVSLIFLPAYFRNEMVTAYTFIERRYGRGAQKAASTIFMVTRLLADGVRIFATAIPLSIVTGFSYPLSISLICCITVLYTYLGGLRAVVWLDVFQFAIYLLGAGIAAAVMLGKIPGGLAEVVELGSTNGKLQLFDFRRDLTQNYTFYSGIIGGAFLGLASHGTDQLIVQRLLACRSLRDGQKALVSSGIVVMAQFLFFLGLGVLLYVYYQHVPLAAQIQRNDEIFPYFIATDMPPGVGGVLIAAIFAAAMSTLSSSLNALASSSVVDWLVPVVNRQWAAETELRIARGITVLWALLLIFVAILAGSWENVLEAGLSVASFTYGGLLGAFLFGLTKRRIAEVHIIVAMLAGVLFMLYISQTGVAWPWYVPAGTAATFAAGTLLSARRPKYSPPT